MTVRSALTGAGPDPHGMHRLRIVSAAKVVHRGKDVGKPKGNEGDKPEDADSGGPFNKRGEFDPVKGRKALEDHLERAKQGLDKPLDQIGEIADADEEASPDTLGRIAVRGCGRPARLVPALYQRS